MAVNILTPMPPRAARRAPRVELVELRVLDGPNRFFTRPAVKLEFIGTSRAPRPRSPSAPALRCDAWPTGWAPGAPNAVRHSVDGLRSAIAYPWRRRTISQAMGASAARIGARPLESSGASSPGCARRRSRPLATCRRPRIPIVAVTGTNGKSTTTRLIAHVASEARMRDDELDGIYVDGELVEAGDWTGFGGAGGSSPSTGSTSRPRDGARRDPPARDRLRGERRERRHERQRRPPRAAGDRHRRRARRGQGHDRSDHEARRMGRPQRRRPARVGDARETRANVYAFSLDPMSPRSEALRRGGGRGARGGLDRAPAGRTAAPA